VARTDGPMRIRVLSNRPDLLSGGDALIEVELPRGVRPRQVRVRAGKRNVTKRFAVRRDGRYVGRVHRLKLGRTVLTARAPGHRTKQAVINHRNGGPVFSGPQTKHYRCQEGARNARCHQPPTYTLLYKSSNPLR